MKIYDGFGNQVSEKLVLKQIELAKEFGWLPSLDRRYNETNMFKNKVNRINTKYAISFVVTNKDVRSGFAGYGSGMCFYFADGKDAYDFCTLHNIDCSRYSKDLETNMTEEEKKNNLRSRITTLLEESLGKDNVNFLRENWDHHNFRFQLNTCNEIFYFKSNSEFRQYTMSFSHFSEYKLLNRKTTSVTQNFIRTKDTDAFEDFSEFYFESMLEIINLVKSRK